MDQTEKIANDDGNLRSSHNGSVALPEQRSLEQIPDSNPDRSINAEAETVPSVAMINQGMS